jgi:zinc and cadmium transporter
VSPAAWIVASGLLMAAISLTGALTLRLGPRAQRALILPLVAFAAGSLLGGALLHLLPEATARAPGGIAPFAWATAGFTAFLAIEELLHWHHCERAEADCRKPLGALLMVADTLHNLLDGVAVGAAFVADVRVGLTTLLAVAAHEVPQELGDFAVLLHAGWSPRRALLVNALSSTTFLLGGLGVALLARPGGALDVGAPMAFAAGSFIYIAASDLVPELQRHRARRATAVHAAAFAAGLLLLALLRGAEG